MNKILRRLLTFFIGLPLVVLVVYFTPLNHLLLHCAITIFAFIASTEIYNLLSKSIPMQNKWLVVGFATLIPVSAYVCILLNLDFSKIEEFEYNFAQNGIFLYQFRVDYAPKTVKI